MDSFFSVITLTLVWLMFSYLEQAYCRLEGTRSWLNLIVVELGMQCFLIGAWCSEYRWRIRPQATPLTASCAAHNRSRHF